MADETSEKPKSKPEELLTPLMDSVNDPEPNAEDPADAIEKKGEPPGGGNFA